MAEEPAHNEDGHKAADNAHDVDKGPITGEVPFDSDSHTDGATAAEVDADTDMADDELTEEEASDVDEAPNTRHQQQ
jgi:hypothetical protein